MALRSTIWMTLLGKQGFVELGHVNLSRAHHAAERIAALDGYALAHPERPFFNEFVVRTPVPAAEVNRRLLEQHGVLGGYDLGRLDPADDHLWLVAVTDVNTADDITRLVDALETIR